MGGTAPSRQAWEQATSWQRKGVITEQLLCARLWVQDK